jgi:hypothetical protein
MKSSISSPLARKKEHMSRPNIHPESTSTTECTPKYTDLISFTLSSKSKDTATEANTRKPRYHQDSCHWGIGNDVVLMQVTCQEDR